MSDYDDGFRAGVEAAAIARAQLAEERARSAALMASMDVAWVISTARRGRKR